MGIAIGGGLAGVWAASAVLFREMYEGIANGRVVHEGSHRLVRGTVEIVQTLASLLTGAGH